MRVALLTGGGDCPGLNAVIYAAVKKGINHYGDEFFGFLDGWKGVLENRFIPLTLEAIDGIQLKGGTILHSSRTNVKKIPGGIEKVQEVLKLNKIDALIALGGDDTQSVTLYLSENGLPAVGVPKTIDNDISGTDQTFGFDTAVAIATEAVDRIHTTADSHNRVVVIEVMGRDAGWIAYAAGIAGGAHVVLVPELEIDIDHVCALLKYNYDHGKRYGVVVVAEGCHLPEVGQVIGSAQVDSFGHARLSGIGEALAELIEKKTGFETRSVNLGHTQRGGVPTAFDRLLGQRYGLHAIDMVHDKKWGRIAVLHGTDITDITIKEAIATNRRLYREDDFTQLYEIELACFEPPIRFSRQTMRKFLSDSASAAWIAEEEGQMAGFAIVYWAHAPEQPLAYIQTLEVAPAQRNRGVARELLRRIEESARAAGAHVIWLHVAESNAAAIRLYEAHGYGLQGREANYYAQGIHALLYAKAIE